MNTLAHCHIDYNQSQGAITWLLYTYQYSVTIIQDFYDKTNKAKSRNINYVDLYTVF